MGEWTPMTGRITAQVRRDVAVLTLNRPERLNALTIEMRRELAAALRHFGAGTHARGVVLTGAGRAFCAGEDLTQVDDADTDIVTAVESFHELTRSTLAASVPTVAAINGLAVGGASELTLCFDSRLGSPRAGYFMPENHIGLVISNATSLLLPRLVGTATATRLVLESRRLDAEEARAAGLLDAIVPGDVVEAAIDRIHAWTGEHSATAAHLRLLRPQPEEVEAAMSRETAVAREVWDDGTSQAGVAEFWRRKAATGGPAVTG